MEKGHKQYRCVFKAGDSTNKDPVISSWVLLVMPNHVGIGHEKAECWRIHAWTVVLERLFWGSAADSWGGMTDQFRGDVPGISLEDDVVKPVLWPHAGLRLLRKDSVPDQGAGRRRGQPRMRWLDSITPDWKWTWSLMNSGSSDQVGAGVPWFKIGIYRGQATDELTVTELESSRQHKVNWTLQHVLLAAAFIR